MMPETVSSKDILTPEQVAKIMGVCKDTVYSMCDSGKIPCRKFGNRRRIPGWLLIQWLNNSGKEATPE